MVNRWIAPVLVLLAFLITPVTAFLTCTQRPKPIKKTKNRAVSSLSSFRLDTSVPNRTLASVPKPDPISKLSPSNLVEQSLAALNSNDLNCSYRLVRFKQNDRLVRMGLLVSKDWAYDISDLLDRSRFGSPQFHDRICRIFTLLKMESRLKVARVVDVGEANLISPIPQPRNIIGVTFNYKEFRKATGRKASVVFPKRTIVTGPFTSIEISEEDLANYEVELGVVLSKRISETTFLTNENLLDYVYGFVLVNDVTDIVPIIRDLEKGYAKGKSRPTFQPVGPYLVPAESIPLDHRSNPRLNLRSYVNAELKQNSNSKHMIHSILGIIEKTIRNRNEIWTDSIGRTARLLPTGTLEPGDLVLTGTPAGGAARTPSQFETLGLVFEGLFHLRSPFEEKIAQDRASGRFLKVGDRVELDGGILGSQKSAVVSKRFRKLANSK